MNINKEVGVVILTYIKQVLHLPKKRRWSFIAVPPLFLYDEICIRHRRRVVWDR